MVVRGIVPTVSLTLAGLVILAWLALQKHEQDQIARVMQAESYAARSQLVREMETQLRALRDVARFWATYGRLPADQWKSDARIELSHFDGIRVIVWDDPQRDVRYAATPPNLRFSQRPSEDEWAELKKLVAKPDGPANAERMLGPTRDADGHYVYRVRIPEGPDGSEGVLVALVDAHDMLAELLRDQSPGYRIEVRWKDEELFSRGEADVDAPPAWTRSGVIKLSMGPAWTVVHKPSEKVVARLRSPAMLGLLLAGLTVSLLVGVLLFQNERMRVRAQTAERAERRIVALNADLERQVSDRTHELAERTADLETISESVSHDLRSPLNTIALNLYQLHLADGNQTDIDAGASPVVQRMDNAVRQMVHVLDRMRNFSTVTYTPFHRAVINMAELSQQVFDELVHSETTPVSLDIMALPKCRADRTLAEILLFNLFSNALKYTRQRAERSIRVGFEANESPTVYFVRDNGIGFDAAQAGHLFEPFQRLGRQDRDGQGVGLAIAARVVHRHGGRIWAEGSPGQGATFYFDLGPGSVEPDVGLVSDS